MTLRGIEQEWDLIHWRWFQHGRLPGYHEVDADTCDHMRIKFVLRGGSQPVYWFHNLDPQLDSNDDCLQLFHIS